MGTSILVSGLSVWLFMTLIFMVALLRKDNSIVDIAWGFGFLLIAVLTFFLRPGMILRHLLITLLVSLWGLRLMIYIFRRNMGKGEDFRYAKWRRDWGKWFVPRSYLQVFMIQGLFMLIIAWPIILTNSSLPSGLGWLDCVGAGIWLIGFFFEGVGDLQLVRFKKYPLNKGKIMTEGLWRLTRHPNYFGEVVMWWGIYLIAFSVPLGWTAIISPVLITFLLLRISGVTMLEKKYADNPEYAAYMRRTSAFFPLPPRKG
jgi:steroid 5-alpha reductase family enzyme